MAISAIKIKQKRFSGALAYNTASSQVVQNASWMAVNWQAEQFDTDNYWTISSPSKLTIPSNGYYVVTLNIQTDTTTAGGNLRAIAIWTNGSATNYDVQQRTAVSDYLIKSCSNIYKLNLGDFLEGYVYQDSGGASGNIGFTQSNFSIVRVG